MSRGKDPSIDAYRLLQSAREKSAGSHYPVTTDGPVPFGAPRRSADLGAHGPFAGPEEVAPQPVAPKREDPRSALADALRETSEQPFPSPAAWPPGVWLLLLVALGTAFGLGRLSVGGSVAAAAPGDEPQEVLLAGEGGGASAPAEARAATAPPAGMRPEDLAFTESRTRYSIATITFGFPRGTNDEVADRNQSLALANFRYLGEQGLPVVTPRIHGKNLLLFVGAAREQGDLDELLATVRALPGPDGRGRPYESAMIQPIEAYRGPAEIWTAER